MSPAASTGSIQSAPAASVALDPTEAREPAQRKLSTKPTATSPVSSHVAKPAATKPPSTVAPPEAANNSAACDACMSAASAGDISAAARNYATCADSSAKSRCSASARFGALRAALIAMRNRDCSKVSAIAEAARSMGAESPPLEAAVARCY